MKIVKFLFVIAVVSTAFVSCKNNKSGMPKLATADDSASFYLGVYYGGSLKNAEIPAFNEKIFAEAVKNEIENKEKESKFKPEEVSMFLQKYFTQLSKKQAEKNLKEGKEFLEKNKARKEVKTTASGLQYEIIKEGNGANPTEDQFVNVQYKGTLIDGTTFDSSYDRGQPAKFPVKGIIPGLQEGLQLMKVGGKYKFYIPSELGYGENQSGGKIKPNSTLIFEIELLGTEAAPKAEDPQAVNSAKPAKK